MKKVATLILNRNLPFVTDKLVAHLKQYDGDMTDIFVIEAGSDEENLSEFCTWHVNTPEARAKGLRYSRGMNYGLSQLWKSDDFKNYDAFFLLTNDTEFSKAPTIKPLVDLLEMHKRVGIISPCSEHWGEKLLLGEGKIKYFWFIHNNAYLLRREFIESICDKEQPDELNFLFDGSNFRGYGSEMELIAKAYVNEWAAAITSQVWVDEDESHLIKHADLIKTESYDENLKLYIDEGLKWMKKKYGFNNRWMMQEYVKYLYEQFFEYNNDLIKYKI